TIPVSFQVDGESYTVELKVTVMPLDVDQELTEALESIDIPNKDDVRGNITLPETTSNGLDITWTTDRADIVNVEPIPATVEGYDDTPAGTVTRPASDTVVTVTAQVTLADQTAPARDHHQRPGQHRHHCRGRLPQRGAHPRHRGGL